MDEKKKKLSFFHKIILAITDFRLYPYVIKTEKLIKSFMHFVFFILLLTLLITISFSNKLLTYVDGFLRTYDESIPEFTLTSGALSIEEKFNKQLLNDTVIIVNTEYDYEAFKNSEDYMKDTKYDNRIIVNSDAITYESYTELMNQLEFAGILEDYNKASFYEEALSIYNSFQNKAIIFMVIFVVVFISYGIAKFLDLILLTMIVSMTCIIFGIKMEWKNYFKISIYAMTLSLIIEAISLMTVGAIKDYTSTVSLILSLVYVYYAIRAIKLDAFILIFSKGKKPKGTGIMSEIEKKIKDEMQNISKTMEDASKEDNINNEDEKNNENDNSTNLNDVNEKTKESGDTNLKDTSKETDNKDAKKNKNDSK